MANLSRVEAGYPPLSLWVHFVLLGQFPKETLRRQLFNEFRFRVGLYDSWDRRLMSYTRFFGAAAATNALLSKLATDLRFCVSQSTLKFLAKAGGSLQIINLRLAQAVVAGHLQPASLDEHIIFTEQTTLEHELRNLAHSNENVHDRTVREIDRLLNCLRADVVAIGSRHSNLRLCSDALRSVARELWRPPTFASQFDRMRIGHYLIHHLRQRQTAEPLSGPAFESAALFAMPQFVPFQAASGGRYL